MGLLQLLGRGLMLNRFKAWIKPHNKADSVESAATRFIHLFETHGVQTSQIPRLIPQLKLSHLKTTESLLDALTPAIIDQAATLFGVRSEWLEGAEDEIYPHHYCYKQPNLFFEHFNTLAPNAYSCPVRMLAVNKYLDFQSDEYQPLVLVLVETVKAFNEGYINRYHIYRDGWDWGYEPSRIQLKAMARLLGRIHPIPIYQVSQDVLDAVLEARMIPQPYLSSPLVTNPCLEDFAESSDQSGAAKEVDELPQVMQYISDYGLDEMATPFKEYRQKADTLWRLMEVGTEKRVESLSEKSRKAAISKNASGNQVKQLFLSRYSSMMNDQGFNASGAARTFYDGLSEVEAIKLFRSEKDFQKLTPDEARDNAVRTLTTALRKYKKQQGH
jgi:hypothetical protein